MGVAARAKDRAGAAAAGPPGAPGGSILAGILLMCAGVGALPFMNVGVKYLAQSYPAPQITWARFTGHLLVMLALFMPRYGIRLLLPQRPMVQIGRSAMMLASNLVYVMAIASVPLLGESVGWRRWTAVLVGFAGAVLVIRPSSGFSDPAVLLILVSSFAYALYQIGTRWVARYDNAATGIVFAALIGSLAMTFVLPFNFRLPTTPLDILVFSGIGVIGGFAHYLIIRAFQIGQAAVIAPLGYVELIGSTVLGYVFFGNLPDLWTWIGAAVIVASGVYIALRERTLRRNR